MEFVTLHTATSITGLSKRTLWRRIAAGAVRTEDASEPGERTGIAVDDVLSLSQLRLEPDDRQLILDADAGAAEAQCDLALLFLGQNRAVEAVRWLERAANQSYPDAMHWLGRCFIAGNGVLADERQGVEWITRAANYGHVTAQHMVRYLYDPNRPRLGPEQLEAALDTIEQKVVLPVLQDTADPV